MDKKPRVIDGTLDPGGGRMPQYLGNSNTKEVHNLYNKQSNCQINEIHADHKVEFTPDSLDQAHREGYDNCAWCIGGSKR